MDLIDPRIFLSMPEHVSNAYSTWNSALFLAQISKIESALTDTFSKQGNDDEPSCLNSANFPIINNFNMLKTSSSSSNLDNQRNVHQIEQIFNNFNESMMKIYKVKKRNKASLYNLIIPFDFNINDTDKQNRMISFLKSTTPWHHGQSLHSDGYQRFGLFPHFLPLRCVQQHLAAV
ncbi:hypothetical protein BpHYR1_005934 [Brachionus plicatilis]|uniref:Uncharacterized protein n=1 Tax=Brachionus plicatilis TaxID=10195 RepID=A0A3M7SR69_BRAPC|nr:hypothetical protein BpHYR1_005934 [Brachionus plicatilis]